MNKKHIIGFVISLYLIIVSIPEIKAAQAQNKIEIAPPSVIIEQSLQEKIDQMSIVEIIDFIAPQFNQDPKLINKIIKCESGYKVKNHDNNRAMNVTGIHDATFNRWLPLYEKDKGESLNINSQFDQIKMMSYAFSKGESYRDDWTTYVAYTKGGTYAFYSKLLKKNFVVNCK